MFVLMATQLIVAHVLFSVIFLYRSTSYCAREDILPGAVAAFKCL